MLDRGWSSSAIAKFGIPIPSTSSFVYQELFCQDVSFFTVIKCHNTHKNSSRVDVQDFFQWIVTIVVHVSRVPAKLLVRVDVVKAKNQPEQHRFVFLSSSRPTPLL